MADVTPVPHDISELLTAYLDGELQPGELEIVVEHLTNCSNCILDFHDLKETRAALRSLPYLKAPEHVVASGHYGASLSAYLDGEVAGVREATLDLPGPAQGELPRLRRALEDQAQRRASGDFFVTVLALVLLALVAMGGHMTLRNRRSKQEATQ